MSSYNRSKKTTSVLGWVVKEMESRYRLMTKEGLEILMDTMQNTNFQCPTLYWWLMKCQI